MQWVMDLYGWVLQAVLCKHDIEAFIPIAQARKRELTFLPETAEALMLLISGLCFVV